MKIDRLIGIITILLQREKVTAPQLAQRFEVSRRTISRDIEDICRAGIPLVTEPGYGGGISIAEGYKIDRSLLTEDELLLLFSGLKGVDSVMGRCAGIAEKLSVKSPDAAEDIILIDLASHYQAPLTQKAGLIKTAIQTRRLLSFRYYYEKGECRRTIEPYKLVFHWGAWYVWGYCLDRRAFRLFKLNRLWEAQAGPECFTPRALPLEELELDRRLSAGSIRLKAVFEPGEAYRLIDEYGVGCYQETEEGLLFTWDFVSYRNMLEWVLSFGGHVRVLEPRELRADLRKTGEVFLAHYGET